MKHSWLGVVAAALAAACALPAGAQPPSIGESYLAADAIFGEQPPGEIADGLDGRWLPLSTLAGGPGAPPVGVDGIHNFVEKFCGEQVPILARVEAAGQTSFVMTTGPQERSVAYRFDWLGGSRFSRSFDPDAFLGALGLDRGDDQAALDRRAQALRQAPREVELYRTAPDILVIQNDGRAEIYGRCPD